MLRFHTDSAVTFQDVCFSVDRNKQQIDILKSVNFNVPNGCIFGLLGPSSCGKTTLLRCLVGLLQPTSGNMILFGRNSTKDNGCEIPGSNVGYMPQDLGLYEDFTICQLLTMFGRYMKMDTKLIKSRIKFMAQFLELPEVDREIASLSGGQKRRVSFAIACLHMPPLIILDEPTVGVDPLLRQSIWKYLKRLAEKENKTIIITTHYIEEAAQADQVAMMRAGEILVQDSPKNIMESHRCNTLEEAFLRICNGPSKLVQTSKLGGCCIDGVPKPIYTTSMVRRLNKSFIVMWALLYKNYLRNVNSIPLLAFQFMLPIIQMISFSLCVGGKPTNIGLGLVNLDQPIQLFAADLLIGNSSLIDELDPGEELLSTKYLGFIDNSMLSIRPYANLGDALRDVRSAKLWAAMEIGENFSSTISQRFDLDNFYQLDAATIGQSVIKLYPDRSNKVLDMICLRSLINSYRQFLKEEFEHFSHLPLEVKKPIFSIKPNLISNSIDGYTESMAAGLLASLTYIMAAGLTTFIMVVERSAGILERTFTSGINPAAYLLAHAIFRSIVMMIQVLVVMFLTFYLLEQPLVGSIWTAYFMLMSLNLTGISYGLLVSSLVTDQNGAALTIVSSLVFKITTSGILWPVEAMPHWLRYVCYLQPLTIPVQALKMITLKGSGLADSSVQLGFLVSISWLLVFLYVAARRFKFYQH